MPTPTTDTDADYKDDAIDHGLEWIKDYYRDQLDFTEDKDEQLKHLKATIQELYHKPTYYSNDVQDACYSCVKRRIDEALDLPIEQLCPLLMENTDTGLRRVTNRLYYPKAGKK